MSNNGLAAVGGILGIAPLGDQTIVEQLEQAKLIGQSAYTFSRKRDTRNLTLRIGTPDKKQYIEKDMHVAPLSGVKANKNNRWQIKLEAMAYGSKTMQTDMHLTGKIKYVNVDVSQQYINIPADQYETFCGALIAANKIFEDPGATGYC